MTNSGEKIDITDRATAGGMPLPTNWRVLLSAEDSAATPQQLPESDVDDLTVQWWREGRWKLVDVTVALVNDTQDQCWAAETATAVKSGTLPTHDSETGAVTSRELDPLTDDDLVEGLIMDALGAAAEVLVIRMRRLSTELAHLTDVASCLYGYKRSSRVAQQGPREPR